MISTAKIHERAVLVGLATNEVCLEKEQEYIDELAFLAETAEVDVVHTFIQKVDFPQSKFYVGSGKLEEIKHYIEDNDIDTVIFDDELSPAQLRNIEGALHRKVLDRTTLILDIFARHARTAHARTQVELAQYQYLLPRLTGMWTHLSKQRGGVGMRGPGEKEIETDRRVIRNKISLLKERLAEIDKQKTTQRKHREQLVRVALVGYT
ncbi:MAG: GTPase HflX, partial [Bacteroidales bacterium]|nr:GTPase HflX [Bacteroidales bacterium]